ncbi:MAG: hypothetical protein OYH77_08545 [Pseudomonadota bacterium]|nr:hypothetical protein [Pseudomonadota bacterium]
MRGFCLTIILGLFFSLFGSFASLQAATPLVAMASKLNKSPAGRVLQRRLSELVGQRMHYTYVYHGQVWHFTGKVKQIVIPDIHRLDGSFANAEFKAKFSDVVATDGQGVGQFSALIGETAFSNITGIKAQHDNGSYIGAVARVQAPDILDGRVAIARFVGNYTDLSDRTFHELLIETTDDGIAVEPRTALVRDEDILH